MSSQMTAIRAEVREKILQDLLDSVHRHAPGAVLDFEHTKDGVWARVRPPATGRQGQCVEITVKGKRCKFEAEIGDRCELHHNQRQRRLQEEA